MSEHDSVAGHDDPPKLTRLCRAAATRYTLSAIFDGGERADWLRELTARGPTPAWPGPRGPVNARARPGELQAPRRPEACSGPTRAIQVAVASIVRHFERRPREPEVLERDITAEPDLVTHLPQHPSRGSQRQPHERARLNVARETSPPQLSARVVHIFDELL